MRLDVTHCRKRPRWERATLLALLQQEQSRPGIEVQENRHTHDVELDPPQTAPPALGVMPPAHAICRQQVCGERI